IALPAATSAEPSAVKYGAGACVSTLLSHGAGIVRLSSQPIAVTVELMPDGSTTNCCLTKIPSMLMGYQRAFGPALTAKPLLSAGSSAVRSELPPWMLRWRVAWVL